MELLHGPLTTCSLAHNPHNPHNRAVRAAGVLACQPYEAPATTPCEREERGTEQAQFHPRIAAGTAGRMTPFLAFGLSVTTSQPEIIP